MNVIVDLVISECISNACGGNLDMVPHQNLETEDGGQPNGYEIQGGATINEYLD